MRPLVAALLLVALPASAELKPEIKEALEEGCPKLAREKKDAPCAGVANLAEYMLLRVGAKIGAEGHKYCAQLCEKERAKKVRVDGRE